MRRCALSGFIIALLFVSPAWAGYENLVASSDGTILYFTPRAGLYTGEWTGSPLSSIQLRGEPMDDIDAHGAVTAITSYGERFCGFAGSSCFLRSPCSASVSVKGPGIDINRLAYRTFVRLNRAGNLAWLEQRTSCPIGLLGGVALPIPLDGLYQLPSLTQVAPSNGASLANRRAGRRLITDRGAALTFAGPQLQWIDSTGAHQIRHVFGASEAVTDAAGDNVVYADTAGGGLHWIASGADEELKLTGSAPALSDDGKTLVFLSVENRLQVYDRGSRAVRSLGDGTYTEFTLGGPYVFAVMTGNLLVRIELASGATTTLGEPFPEIDSAFAPKIPVTFTCPLVCYGTPESAWYVSPGMLFVLQGRWLDTAGWRLQAGSLDEPLRVISSTEAYVLIPQATAVSQDFQTAELVQPGTPVRIPFRFTVQAQVAACLGTLSGDFTSIVSNESPAAAGDVVHVFLTGMQGTESVPDNVPNPVDHLVPLSPMPVLTDPGAFQPLFAGLAPGLISMQQVDLRVVRKSDQPLFETPNSNCGPVPVAP
jgi:uncharacterized protein (TIGR03437 family)